MESLDQIIKDSSLQAPAPVVAPFEYLVKMQGKKVRTRLLYEFAKLYEVPAASVDAVSEFIDELHTASLLIDDIEDNAELRRGKVAAHKKFGIWTTLNSAQCAVYIAISKLLGKENHASLPSIINEELIRLHFGQGQDIYWRDNGIVPSLEEYYEMAKNKTGGLFRLMVRLLQALSSNKERSKDYDLIPLANAAGILYQIRDDYLNLFSNQMFEQKGFADDLTEGKFSFPIIHGITLSHSVDGDNYVLKTILSKPTDIDTKTQLLDYLKEKTHTDVYTREIINSLGNKVISEFIPDELDSIKAILSKLCDLN